MRSAGQCSRYSVALCHGLIEASALLHRYHYQRLTTYSVALYHGLIEAWQNGAKVEPYLSRRSLPWH